MDNDPQQQFNPPSTQPPGSPTGPIEWGAGAGATQPPPPPPPGFNAPPGYGGPQGYNAPAGYHGAPGANAPAPTTAWAWNAASIATIGGAAAVILGAFLPWAKVGGLSVSGTEGDGVLTLILGVAAGLMGGFGILRGRSGLLVGSMIAALLALAIGGYDASNINSVADGPFGLKVTVGMGLYLTILGGIAGIVGPILAMRSVDS